jgi:hypothetical protein
LRLVQEIDEMIKQSEELKQETMCMRSIAISPLMRPAVYG